MFVNKFNEFTKPYGIEFGEFQVDKSVNYLDVTLSLGEKNIIDFKVYRKPSDARRYLQTDSFHLAQVFQSVIFSLMIRVIKRNSQDHTCVADLAQLKEDLSKSGYDKEKMEELEPLAVQRAIKHELYEHQSRPRQTESDKVVFSVKYFQEIDELKKIVRLFNPDIQRICGDLQVTFALRKASSIGDRVVRNRRLSDSSAPETPPLEPEEEPEPVARSHRCEGSGCRTCPYVFNYKDCIMINGMRLFLDFNLNCKAKCIIYVAQCINFKYTNL